MRNSQRRRKLSGKCSRQYDDTKLGHPLGYSMSSCESRNSCLILLSQPGGLWNDAQSKAIALQDSARRFSPSNLRDLTHDHSRGSIYADNIDFANYIGHSSSPTSSSSRSFFNTGTVTDAFIDSIVGVSHHLRRIYSSKVEKHSGGSPERT